MFDAACNQSNASLDFVCMDRGVHAVLPVSPVFLDRVRRIPVPTTDDLLLLDAL